MSDTTALPGASPGMRALYLRCVRADGSSPSPEANGFNWLLDVGAEVVAPDWDPTPECGHGLHGWRWGVVGDSGGAPVDAEGVRWLVFSAESDVDLGGKIKVERARIEYVAPSLGTAGRSEAVAYLDAHGALPHPTAWAMRTAGYRGIATAGYLGIATAGYGGNAAAGDYGNATAGDYGNATAGYRGAATAGYRGTASAGDGGTLCLGGRRRDALPPLARRHPLPPRGGVRRRGRDRAQRGVPRRGWAFCAGVAGGSMVRRVLTSDERLRRERASRFWLASFLVWLAFVLGLACGGALEASQHREGAPTVAAEAP